jgi:transcription-repair coupling factor (superfamily II helicase)
VKRDAPSLNNLISVFSEHSSFQCFQRTFIDNHNLSVSGLSGFALSLFLVSLHKSFNRPILVITNDSTEAEYIRDDLEVFSSGDNFPVCFLPEAPKSSVLFSDIESINSFYINDFLRRLINQETFVSIATIASSNTPLPSKEIFNVYNRTYRVNDHLSRDVFIKTLLDTGYCLSDIVESPLEYCVKGGIVDFFPPDSLLPYRLEFFGDVLESIRTFNPDSQLSVNTVSSFSFQPPVIASPDQKGGSNIFSYLSPDTILVFLHSELLNDSALSLGPALSLFIKSHALVRHYDLLSTDIVFSFLKPEININVSALKNKFISLLRSFPDLSIFIFCSDESHIERLNSLLEIDQINYYPVPISGGVEIPDLQLFIYTEHELFKRPRKANLFRKYSRDVPVEKFNPHEIVSGDIIVHINYGIGRYAGLTKIKAFGSMRECLTINYLGNDKVFVPLEKLNYIQKYVGGSDHQPQLNRLGSTDWERTKLKARRSLDEVSKELIALYAKRLSTSGFAFNPDNDLQYQMESDFIYDETADQITAINEVKNDMERARPMDRLLCGDVGFGKTEVAIRASFKAVLNSKQVAILVPTTILADQHFSVFSRRLLNYPVNIAVLSRFIPKKKQSQIIKDLALGNIDILIGTHRLLSKDVQFKDLGLLIIDEEHRFGVKDKEKIKFLRESIDVLALSATPIPRSLHFSLIGARDFSVINTPPISRLPVITDVIVFDMNIITCAIRREINRGGQVYFVHNNIKTIGALCQKLSEVLPDINIAYVHGQMPEEELENIMSAFINNEINLLVTTTIIESGIDIPNANTIFIDNAHHYGLAQLYQLRGRVGRSSRRAYAFLIVPDPSRIKPDALKKLQTIKKYTALGSGYNVALQDLEIRGAGNLFGSSQSGNIEAIGYELYVKFLREALAENNENLETLPEKIRSDTEVFCPLPAFFPEDYISDSSARLEYYRRLSVADQVSVVDDISSAIRDIYGRFPVEAINLFNISKIRIAASGLGIKKVILAQRSVQLVWDDSFTSSLGDGILSGIRDIAMSQNLTYKFIPHGALHLTLFLIDGNLAEKTICFLNLLTDSLNL